MTQQLARKMIGIILLLLLTSCLDAQAAPCAYPKKPINWILRYCAMHVGSDDETLIQDSSCFKSAEMDSHASDTCITNEKYKTKICHEFMMETKKYASIKSCLNDTEIAPFISG